MWKTCSVTISHQYSLSFVFPKSFTTKNRLFAKHVTRLPANYGIYANRLPLINCIFRIQKVQNLKVLRIFLQNLTAFCLFSEIKPKCDFNKSSSVITRIDIFMYMYVCVFMLVQLLPLMHWIHLASHQRNS